VHAERPVEGVVVDRQSGAVATDDSDVPGGDRRGVAPRRDRHHVGRNVDADQLRAGGGEAGQRATRAEPDLADPLTRAGGEQFMRCR
jgi:hypothetical protein